MGFSMRLSDAAKSLGISITSFKQVCLARSDFFKFVKVSMLLKFVRVSSVVGEDSTWVF
jgi:hypothetical protein